MLFRSIMVEAANVTETHPTKVKAFKKLLGDASRTALGDDILIKSLSVRLGCAMHDISYVFVTDAKRIAELEALRDMRAFTVYVYRPVYAKDYVDDFDNEILKYDDYDMIIDNGGTVEDLDRTVLSMLESFGIVTEEYANRMRGL